MPYASQLIIQFNPDAIIATGTRNLARKGGLPGEVPTPFVTITGPPAPDRQVRQLSLALEDLAAPARLYLRGHGDWQNQTLGGWHAVHVADLLSDWDLDDVETVSVTGCNLARDAHSCDLVRITNAADSFASQLHLLLRTECGLATVLHGRTEILAVRATGRKTTRPDVLGLRARHEHHGAVDHTKMTYYWEGWRQRRRWSDSGEEVSLSKHVIPYGFQTAVRLFYGALYG